MIFTLLNEFCILYDHLAYKKYYTELSCQGGLKNFNTHKKTAISPVVIESHRLKITTMLYLLHQTIPLYDTIYQAITATLATRRQFEHNTLHTGLVKSFSLFSVPVDQTSCLYSYLPF